MSLLDDLRDGAPGVRLTLFDGLAIEHDGDRDARLRDPGRPLVWSLAFFPELRLDLDDAQAEGLRRDAERHARFLFAAGSGEGAEGPARAPLLAFERFAIEGGRALAALRRVGHGPGIEAFMGHLLVPTGRGLLEVRWASGGPDAGDREAAAAARATAGLSIEEMAAALERGLVVDADAPEHDALVPDHPLSLARAAGQRLRAEGGLCVTAPDVEAVSGREVTIPSLNGALVPPPRFFYVGRSDAGPGRAFHEFDRVSFSGADGVDRFLVLRDEAPLGDGADLGARLARRAESLGREIHAYAGVRDTRCEARPLEPLGGRLRAEVVVEGEGAAGPLRTLTHWLLDDGARPLCLGIATTAAQPRETLRAEVEAAARSWRRAPA